MNFDSYLKKKQTLNDDLLKLIALMQESNLKTLADKVRADRIQLDNEKFTLVVVGEFSRGKSTFVNAMLGKRILPSSKQATTTVISKIIYDDRINYALCYKDGRRKKISMDDFLGIKAQNEGKARTLLSFVSNKFAKISFDDIEEAEIAYPLEFCKNNVEVIDTPGTNDLNVGRIEITYNYLQHADAAILVLSATQALTQSEKIFLKERILGNQIQNVFVVINFKDALNGADEEERIITYVRENLKEFGETVSKIFLVSSRAALLFRRQDNGEQLKDKDKLYLPSSFAETGFVDFEKALAYFLSEEKGLSKLRKYSRKAQIYIKDIERDLEIRAKAAQESTADLKNQLAVMQPKLEKIKRESQRILKDMQMRLDAEETELSVQCNQAISKIKQAAIDSIDNYQADMDEKAVQALIEEAVTPIKKQLIDDVNSKQKDVITRELQRSVDKLHKIFDDLSLDEDIMQIENQVTNAIEVSLNNDLSASDENGIMYGIGAVIVAAVAGLSGVGLLFAGIAGLIFGSSNVSEEEERIAKIGKLKNQIREYYSKEYADFTNNICRQYKKNSKALCDDLQKEIDIRIDDMENQLKNIIKRKESKQLSVEQELELINKQKLELARIKNSIAEVLEK